MVNLYSLVILTLNFLSNVIVGADAEEELIKLLLEEVKGKDFNELLASGREKMSAVSGGGAAVAVAAAPAGGAGGAAPAAEAKEEKKVEEKEESDDVSFKHVSIIAFV